MGLFWRWAVTLAAAAFAFAFVSGVLRWISPTAQPVSWMHAPSLVDLAAGEVAWTAMATPPAPVTDAPLPPFERKP